MDTAQIKAYAPQARKDFINAVTERAARFGIHGDDNFDPVAFKGDTAIIGSQVFTQKGGELRERLVAKVRQIGFQMFIRSSAYTWFNRFVAIRYMELHGFLDHGFRVLSNPNGSDTPEVLEYATEVDLPGLDKEKVLELRLAGDKDNELYRMLVIAQCNALHNAMPFLFDKIDNEAELLLPDNLLHTHSPVRKMVSEIDESLWEDVEIIGWIYQFYISEKKDEVIGKVVKSEDIPAATQLFTPNWIVKYMVQNTLGRMWMATYPESSLKSKMEYYIEPAEQEPEVQAEIDATTPKELNPEELTFLDPACGSGHILVEAYDILKEIYLERGYRTRDIPRLILSKNIYGLDIDDRAAQLACFAVLMRARKDDRRLFSRDSLTLNVMPIVETRGIDKDKLLGAVSKRDGGKGVWVWINELVELFEYAKTFGSLIKIPDELAEKLDVIISVIESDGNRSDDLFNYISGTVLENLKPILRLTYFLTRKYDCVITNPPYMGTKGMNRSIKLFLQNNYTEVKSDLFSAFIVRNLQFSKHDGNLGFMTPFVWMFLSSYKDLRIFITQKNTITSLTQLEYSGFEGATVPICCFTVKKTAEPLFKGVYIRLSDFRGSENQGPKTLEAINNKDCSWLFEATSKQFEDIPGSPIAYWVSNKIRWLFKSIPPLKESIVVTGGMTTGNNERFLRLWYEVASEKAIQTCSNRTEAIESNKKWFPYNKGGPYRKWFGNRYYYVNWYNDGSEIILTGKAFPRSKQYYFNESLTYSATSSSYFGIRYSDEGFVFDAKGSSCFASHDILLSALGFLASKISSYLLKSINPTIEFQTGNLSVLPFKKYLSANPIIKNLIEISRTDWNSYEISWDFFTFPLLDLSVNDSTLEKSYHKLKNQRAEMVLKTQRLEEQNNQALISFYNLDGDELVPEVPLEEITLTCNPNFRYGKGKTKDEYCSLQLTDTIKELISYSIGCMMGRYSLDHSGLIYANSNNFKFISSKYNSFSADDDGIIPIMDIDWFHDDATVRFIEFIKTAWPSEYLDENLKFVADVLKPKASEPPEETIRRYLSTTFFKDHMKMYKKRPIYWLFSSGKQKAFECLVYLHRYNESTLSRMRSNYVTPLQGNFSARIEFLEHEKDAATTASAQKKIQKQIDVLKKKHVELKTFDDELRHYADMRISLDLDDGVKVNYGKFGNLLAQKKAITGKS